MKTENLHIGFGAIGCALKFKKSVIKRSDGTLEYYKMLYMLVRNPSVSKVTLLQKSDWEKLNDLEKIDFDPRGVLFDPYSDDPENFSRAKVRPADMKDIQDKKEYQNLYNYLSTKEPIDYCTLFIGMGYFTNNSIPDFLASVNQKQFADENKETGHLHLCRIKWDTYNYSAPIVHYLNMTRVPWFMISTDPRYIKGKMRLRDTMNTPTEIISQYETEITWESVDSYEGNKYKNDTETVKNIKLTAEGIEKLSRIREKIISPENERPVRFMMGVMQSKYGQGAGKDERLEMLKHWVFKYDDDKQVEVYGKWSPEVIEGYEEWFKGMLPHEELDKRSSETRYTLIKGIRDKWVTSKWADTLSQGVVPFLVPEYDTQHSVVPKDHFIRVKNPEDLYKKMKYLDEHPEKRIKLVKSLQYKLLKDAKTGTFVFDILNKACKRNNLNFKLEMGINEDVIRKSKTTQLF